MVRVMRSRSGSQRARRPSAAPGAPGDVQAVSAALDCPMPRQLQSHACRSPSWLPTSRGAISCAVHRSPRPQRFTCRLARLNPALMVPTAARPVARGSSAVRRISRDACKSLRRPAAVSSRPPLSRHARGFLARIIHSSEPYPSLQRSSQFPRHQRFRMTRRPL